MSEPTTAEVMRRLDEVSRQLVDVVQQIREDRRISAETFVRKDVYQPLHEALGGRVKNLEGELDRRDADQVQRDRDQAAFRRQMTVAVITVALGALATLLVSLVNLTHGGTP